MFLTHFFSAKCKREGKPSPKILALDPGCVWKFFATLDRLKLWIELQDEFEVSEVAEDVLVFIGPRFSKEERGLGVLLGFFYLRLQYSHSEKTT